MNRIGTFKSVQWGTITISRSTYGDQHGPTAVMLFCEDGEPLATLSVNMYRPECSEDSRDLPAGCFYVKTWGGNEDLWPEALASGMFAQREDLPHAASGFVTAPAWQIVGGAR